MSFTDYNFFGSFNVRNFSPHQTISSWIGIAGKQKNLVEKIVTLSLPLLAMYEPASRVVGVINGALLLGRLKKITSSMNAKKKLVKTTFFVANIAGLFFYPKITQISLTSAELLSHLHQLRKNYALDYKTAQTLLKITHNIVTIALVFKITPQMLLISLCVQAIKELDLANCKYKKGDYLDTIFNMLYALIRLKEAGVQAEVIYRNLYGKELTQEALDTLLESNIFTEAQTPEEPINVASPETEILQAPKDSEKDVACSEVEIITQKLKPELQELKQEDLDRLLSKKQENEKPSGVLAAFIEMLDALAGTIKLTNFSDRLKKGGFKNGGKNLSFDGKKIEHFLFENLNFENSTFKNTSIKASSFINVTLKNCAFTNAAVHKSFFTNSNFQTVIFNQCQLTKTRIFKSIFSNSYFNKCLLEGIEFNWSQFLNVTYKNSNLTGSVFNDAILKDTKFKLCNLFESVFFEAKATNSKMIDCNLKDALLFDSKNQFIIQGGVLNTITRPVIGLLWNFENPGSNIKAVSKIVKNQGIVFKFHIETGENFLSNLENEINGYTQQFKNGLKQSLPQLMIKSSAKDSEIGKIKTYAQKIMQNLDALIVGGGEDIEPQFYGQKKNIGTKTEPTPLKTLLEFSLFDLAEKNNVPTLAICRGVQSLNVFFGGNLNQKVLKNFQETQTLKIKSEFKDVKIKKIISKTIKGSSIKTFSAHKQACDKIGLGLNVVMEHEGVPKLLVSDLKKDVSYPIFIAPQFHPEAYLYDKNIDKSNFNFFSELIEYSKIYKKNKMDVLNKAH